MSEQQWQDFVAWCHRQATHAENGFTHYEWPEAKPVTTEELLTRYAPAKNEQLRTQLLMRAKREMGGIHCVSGAR